MTLRASLLFLFFSIQILNSQSILIDESTLDWTSDIVNYEDAGDSNGLDIRSLSVTDDIASLYLKLELNREILLQSDNELTLIISHQDATMYFNLGNRQGSFRNNGFTDVYHNNLGLVISPTVTSEVFELKLDKKWLFDQYAYELDGNIEIAIRNEITNGDQLPNNEGFISYTLTDTTLTSIPSYTLEKSEDTDFRFCSYNVLFDRMFEGNTRTEYARILSAIDPDIICFQEIYDNTSAQTQNRLLNVFSALDNTIPWYNSKRGNDNIIISRYPIIYEREVAGNGAFILDKDGQQILVINIHLPCCTRDDDRESEIDGILAFIRDLKTGNTNFDLQDNAPIIIAGDANFVGNADQVEALMTGNIFNNNSYGQDVQVDWDDDGLIDLKPFATGFNTMHTFYNPGGSYSKGRLDYTFYSDHSLEAINSFTLDTDGLSTEELQDYNLEPYYTNYASDHYPIVADFKLKELVSTNNASEAFIQISPNPTSDLIYVLMGNSSFKSAIIMNTAGQYLMSSYEPTINVAHLPSGIHILKITTQDNQVFVTKVSKI